jgi:hypothetical protein
VGLHVELDDPQVEAATLRGVEELPGVRDVASPTLRMLA